MALDGDTARSARRASRVRTGLAASAAGDLGGARSRARRADGASHGEAVPRRGRAVAGLSPRAGPLTLVASMQTTAALIEALERAPGVVISLGREVPPEGFTRRPAPG